MHRTQGHRSQPSSAHEACCVYSAVEAVHCARDVVTARWQTALRAPETLAIAVAGARALLSDRLSALPPRAEDTVQAPWEAQLLESIAELESAAQVAADAAAVGCERHVQALDDALEDPDLGALTGSGGLGGRARPSSVCAALRAGAQAALDATSPAAPVMQLPLPESLRETLACLDARGGACGLSSTSSFSAGAAWFVHKVPLEAASAFEWDVWSLLALCSDAVCRELKKGLDIATLLDASVQFTLRMLGEVPDPALMTRVKKERSFDALRGATKDHCAVYLVFQKYLEEVGGAERMTLAGLEKTLRAARSADAQLRGSLADYAGLSDYQKGSLGLARDASAEAVGAAVVSQDVSRKLYELVRIAYCKQHELLATLSDAPLGSLARAQKLAGIHPSTLQDACIRALSAL